MDFRIERRDGMLATYLGQINGLLELSGPLGLPDQLPVLVLELDVLVDLSASEKRCRHLSLQIYIFYNSNLKINFELEH